MSNCQIRGRKVKLAKELVITIKIPLPDISKAGKLGEKILVEGVKGLFPKDKLPKGSTIDYQIKEKEMT